MKDFSRWFQCCARVYRALQEAYRMAGTVLGEAGDLIDFWALRSRDP